MAGFMKGLQDFGDKMNSTYMIKQYRNALSAQDAEAAQGHHDNLMKTMMRRKKLAMMRKRGQPDQMMAGRGMGSPMMANAMPQEEE